MKLSLNEKFILKVIIESFIILFGFFCGFVVFSYAADLSTDPMDSGASSASAEVQSEDPESEPVPQEPDYSSVVYSDDDIIWNEPVESDPYPDSYNQSEDVVVNRQDLEAMISLLNDLSTQLSLYAADVPAGYVPTEDDLAYRADLLETLAGIRDGLLVLTEPAPAEELPSAEESTPDEIESDSAPVLASSEASSSVETDPADSETAESSVDGSSSSEDLSVITEQDFYKLVLGMLFLVCLWPVLTWIYRFLSSFIPV